MGSMCKYVYLFLSKSLRYQNDKTTLICTIKTYNKKIPESNKHLISSTITVGRVRFIDLRDRVRLFFL